MPRAKKETKKVDKKDSSVGKYHLTITVNGETTEFDTDNVAETIAEFNFPALLKTETRIVVTCGDSRLERALNIPTTRRMIMNRVSREILASTLTKFI